MGIKVLAVEGSRGMEVLDGRPAAQSPELPPGDPHQHQQPPHMTMGGLSPAVEGPTPPAPPLPPPVQPPPPPPPQSDGYWNMHLEVLSKLKAENKEWYDGETMEGGMGPGGPGSMKEGNPGGGGGGDPYGGPPYQTSIHQQQQHPGMVPPEAMNGPHGGPPGPPGPHMGQQYHPGHQQHHYQGYMGDMPPHHQQQMGYDQRQYDQRQYDQRGPYEQQYHQYPQYPGHMGHMGHREGDPYSFVDEYSGPPNRPVDEILGGQPKRRGRKPKHIKLMENGGDPLAIAAAQAAHEAKKRKWKQLGPDGKPIPHQVKPRKKVDRFDGIPEDEVSKRILPDHLGPGLDIVIISKFPFQIGINPGLFAAYKGHHYAGPGNHFWKCLFLSGLIPEPLTSDDDFRLLEHGIGFTNIVSRTTRGSSDLTRKEIKEGGQILLTKLQQFQPRIAVFNGKGIYEIFSGKKEFTFGRQPERIEGTRTHVWVMPSSSARCAQLPRALDKVPFYTALRKFKDFLKGTIDELKEEEFTFQVKAKHYKHYKQNAENDPIKQEMIKEEMNMIKQEIGCYEQQEGGCPQMNNEFSDVLGEKREQGYGGEPEMPLGIERPLGMEKNMGLGMEKSMGLGMEKNMGLGGEKNLGHLGEKPMGFGGEKPMGFGSEKSMGFGGEKPMGFVGEKQMGLMGEREIGFGDRDMGLGCDREIGLGVLAIKEDPELCQITKLDAELEEDDMGKLEIPHTLFNLNGMNREQLECCETGTIPIRKKRGRPKKTPDDPNAPPRPRPRPQSADMMMCNGEIPMKKKRGRPKKVLEDGSIPPPKRPGRKPKALKEMLANQALAAQHGWTPQQMQQMGMLNGMMSPTGYSADPGAQNYSQYGHNPDHNNPDQSGGIGQNPGAMGHQGMPDSMGGQHPSTMGGQPPGLQGSMPGGMGPHGMSQQGHPGPMGPGHPGSMGSHPPGHPGMGPGHPGNMGSQPPGLPNNMGRSTPGSMGPMGPGQMGAQGSMGSHNMRHQQGNMGPHTPGSIGSLTPGHPGIGSQIPGGHQGHLGGMGPQTPGSMGSQTPGHPGSMGPHTPGHSGNMGSLTPNHPGNMGPHTPGSMGPHTPNHPGAMGGRGPTPHQFGQSPGYSPGPGGQPHRSTPYSHPPDTPQDHHSVDEEHRELGLSPPPPASPLGQLDFEPPSTIQDGSLGLRNSERGSMTPNSNQHPDMNTSNHSEMTPGHHSDPSHHPDMPSSHSEMTPTHHSEIGSSHRSAMTPNTEMNPNHESSDLTHSEMPPSQHSEMGSSHHSEMTPTHQSEMSSGHMSDDGKPPSVSSHRDQSQLTPNPAQFSNPNTPMDGSSYQNYPSYPSNASHSPSMVKQQVQQHSVQSPSVKNDVSSKSLSGLESLVDQIPSLNEHESNSQHSAHSNSAPCSNPTTPGPPPSAGSGAPFSPGHGPPNHPNYPPGGSSGGPGGSYPSSHYGSPQSSHPYSPHYSSNSTNISTNFSVSSLANSSINPTSTYSSTYDHGSPQPSSSSFSVSSLTSSSQPPNTSPYSNSYSPGAPPPPPDARGSAPPPSHSSTYSDIMTSSMLTGTPPLGSSYMGSPSLMSSPGPMPSMSSSLHSSMGPMTGSQLPYPYSQYSDGAPPYPGPTHSSFPYPPGATGFHVPSPRFPYPSPYGSSPYTQGYSQNAMLERIKQTSMGMGFGSF